MKKTHVIKEGFKNRMKDHSKGKKTNSENKSRGLREGWADNKLKGKNNPTKSDNQMDDAKSIDIAKKVFKVMDGDIYKLDGTLNAGGLRDYKKFLKNRDYWIEELSKVKKYMDMDIVKQGRDEIHEMVRTLFKEYENAINALSNMGMRYEKRDDGNHAFIRSNNGRGGDRGAVVAPEDATDFYFRQAHDKAHATAQKLTGRWALSHKARESGVSFDDAVRLTNQADKHTNYKSKRTRDDQDQITEAKSKKANKLLLEAIKTRIKR